MQANYQGSINKINSSLQLAKTVNIPDAKIPETQFTTSVSLKYGCKKFNSRVLYRLCNIVGKK